MADKPKVVVKLSKDVESLAEDIATYLSDEGFIAMQIPSKGYESLIKEILEEAVVDEEEE